MNSFDLIRLLAACAVILHHTRALEGVPVQMLGRTNFGELGVGAFFVVSGYLVSASYLRSASVWDYLKKRLLRIEPALVVALAVTAFGFGAMATTLPLGEYLARPEVYLYVLRNALLYPVTYDLPGVFAHNPYPAAVNGALWTLRLEFTCYLGVAALGLVGFLRPWIVALLAAAALAVFAALDWLRPALAAGGAWGLVDLAAQYGFLFLAGAFFRLRGGRPPRWALASAVFLATPLWVLGLPVLVVTLGELRSPRLPGDFSYGLYIYAFPLQQMLAERGMLSFWLALAVTTPFAVASWFLVERPALRLKPRASVPLAAHLAPTLRPI